MTKVTYKAITLPLIALFVHLVEIVIFQFIIAIYFPITLHEVVEDNLQNIVIKRPQYEFLKCNELLHHLSVGFFFNFRDASCGINYWI